MHFHGFEVGGDEMMWEREDEDAYEVRLGLDDPLQYVRACTLKTYDLLTSCHRAQAQLSTLPSPSPPLSPSSGAINTLVGQ